MNYIIYDLECTCWRGHPPGLIQEIIEIGAVKVDDMGNMVEQFSAFVKPMVNTVLSPFCKELTHITQAQVNWADTFPEVVEEFMDWIGVGQENYIMLSWGEFDRQMMSIECQRNRIDHEWTNLHVDLKESYTQLRGLRHSFGLLRAVENEGFEFEGTQHRAITDAVNTAKIFCKFIGSWNF